MEEGFAKGLAIVKAKNADYSIDSDAFLNFRACEAFGIQTEIGIIVRMIDKLTRTTNLLKKDPTVRDEAITDTLADLSNYAMILKVFIENERTPKKVV